MPRESRPWTALDVRRLRELRAAGLSRPECAARLGRSVNSVKWQLGRHGIARRRPRPPGRDALLGMVAHGLTSAGMAAELGVTASTVKRWCRLAKIRRRYGRAPNLTLRAAILDYLSAGVGSAAAIARLVGRCREVVGRHLRVMTREGVVRRVGYGKGTRYAVTGKWRVGSRDDAA